MKVFERWMKIVGPMLTIIILIILTDMLAKREAIHIIYTTLSPFIFAVLIAWILNPIVVNLCEKLKIKRWLATIITVVIIVLIITGIIIIIIPKLTEQVTVLIDYVPQVGSSLGRKISEFESYFNTNYADDLIGNITKQLTDIFTQLFSGGLQLLSSSISIVGGIVSALFILFMILMASIYILIDFDKLTTIINNLVPKRMKEDFNFLVKETSRVFIGYLRGLIIETIIVTIISYIAFLVLGLEGALVFGIIVGITNIIPYFGPYIGGVPVALFALSMSTNLFFAVIIAVIVIQQIDGVLIKPKVFGKTTDVHPALSIIAVILFGKLMGFIGVIFAIPITGVVIIIIKFIYGKLVKNYPEIMK